MNLLHVIVRVARCRSSDQLVNRYWKRQVENWLRWQSNDFLQQRSAARFLSTTSSTDFDLEKTNLKVKEAGNGHSFVKPVVVGD